MKATTVRRRVYVSGRVQGVAYRAHAFDEALRLGLRGWVRNRRDGRVETVVEGTPEAVLAFVSWCHKGSPAARVSGVDEQVDASLEELGATFEVRPTV